jgi:hypothetical protein
LKCVHGDKKSTRRERASFWCSASSSFFFAFDHQLKKMLWVGLEPPIGEDLRTARKAFSNGFLELARRL